MEIKIDASKIKGEADSVSQLVTFLRDKTAGEVTNDGGKITLKTNSEGVDKKYIRVLLKKFIHQKELKESYRIISGEADMLLISERKVYEED